MVIKRITCSRRVSQGLLQYSGVVNYLGGAFPYRRTYIRTNDRTEVEVEPHPVPGYTSSDRRGERGNSTRWHQAASLPSVHPFVIACVLRRWLDGDVGGAAAHAW